MIPVLPILVLIGVFGALPVFAIPSPDFLGPLISSLVAIIGMVSVFFGALVAAVQRFARQLLPRDKKIVYATLGVGFVVLVGFIGIIGAIRYQETIIVQREIEQALEQDRRDFEAILKHQQATATEIPSPTTTVVMATTSQSTTPALSTDLISSRVPSSTLLVSTKLLKEVVAQPNWSDRIMVLDIREPEEREIGYVLATTTQMRYGDLIHAKTVDFPHDRDLLVTCWTSRRGTEIVTWLRAHGYPRAYAILGGLQGDSANGHVGWIDADLPWTGDSKWSQKFVNFTYLSVADAKKRFDEHPVIVDTRSEELFAKEHLPGSYSLPIKYMSSEDVASTIQKLSTSTKELIVVCSEYVDCFYARILGVRLSRLGWDFDYPLRDLATWKKKGYPLELKD